MQIRTELMNRGFDLSDYANAMAVIHNTLKRLDKQGELMTVKNPGGQIVAYTTRWQGGLKALYESGMRGDEQPPTGFSEDHPASIAQRADKEKREKEKADRIARIKAKRD